MFQLSSASTLGLHTIPASTTNAIKDPFEASEVHCVPRYIFKYTAFETRAAVGHLSPTLWKVVGGWAKHILLFMAIFILLVTEFSALKQKMLSY